MDYRDTRVTAYREYGGATAYGLPGHQSHGLQGVRWSHGLWTTGTPESRLTGSTVEARLMDYRHTRVLTTVESRFIGVRWSHGLLTTMTPLSSSHRIIVLFNFH